MTATEGTAGAEDTVTPKQAKLCPSTQYSGAEEARKWADKLVNEPLCTNDRYWIRKIINSQADQLDASRAEVERLKAELHQRSAFTPDQINAEIIAWRDKLDTALAKVGELEKELSEYKLTEEQIERENGPELEEAAKDIMERVNECMTHNQQLKKHKQRAELAEARVKRMQKELQNALDFIDDGDSPSIGNIVQDNLVAQSYVELCGILESVREVLATDSPEETTNG